MCIAVPRRFFLPAVAPFSFSLLSRPRLTRDSFRSAIASVASYCKNYYAVWTLLPVTCPLLPRPALSAQPEKKRERNVQRSGFPCARNEENERLFPLICCFFFPHSIKGSNSVGRRRMVPCLGWLVSRIMITWSAGCRYLTPCIAVHSQVT